MSLTSDEEVRKLPEDGSVLQAPISPSSSSSGSLTTFTGARAKKEQEREKGAMTGSSSGSSLVLFDTVVMETQSSAVADVPTQARDGSPLDPPNDAKQAQNTAESVSRQASLAKKRAARRKSQKVKRIPRFQENPELMKEIRDKSAKRRQKEAAEKQARDLAREKTAKETVQKKMEEARLEHRQTHPQGTIPVTHDEELEDTLDEGDDVDLSGCEHYQPTDDEMPEMIHEDSLLAEEVQPYSPRTGAVLRMTDAQDPPGLPENGLREWTVYQRLGPDKEEHLKKLIQGKQPTPKAMLALLCCRNIPNAVLKALGPTDISAEWKALEDREPKTALKALMRAATLCSEESTEALHSPQASLTQSQARYWDRLAWAVGTKPHILR